MKHLKRFKLPRLSKSNVWLAIGVLMIAAALMLGGINVINSWLYTRNHKVQAQGLKNTPAVESSSPLVAGTPVHITIPSVAIDLKVDPGYYNPSTKSWNLSDVDAQWGVMTAKANNKGGDTYIYGHALMNVFGRLPKVQPGDLAVVTTDNSHTFTYKFVSSTETTPDDTSLFKYQGKPILVLQTCSGLWYQYRQLFVFDLIQVDGKRV
jgi:LPXTG-site transpeptidase (sortase) family protein